MSHVVEKYPDTEALVAAAGDRLVEAITGAIDSRGAAHIVLTGAGITAKEGGRCGIGACGCGCAGPMRC
jgi:6-phosphogluconolactonase